MQRRRFIAALCAGASLSGCLSGGSVPPEETVTPMPEQTPTVGPPDSLDPATPEPPTGDPSRGTDDSGVDVESEPETSRSEQQSTAFSVGDTVSEVNPLGVVIRDERAAARVVRIVVEDTRQGEIRLDRRDTLRPGGEVRGEIRTPSRV